MKTHVIHENAAPTALLIGEREAHGLPYADWHLDEGVVDPQAASPEGAFYNRMTGSSHTRGHRYAPELTSHVLSWLAAHGRRLINGPGAIRLEINRLAQYAALEAAGIATPRTVAAANGIEVTGIEFIRDRTGRALTYDVNTSTNCNSAAEAPAGVQPGMARLAEYLGEEL